MTTNKINLEVTLDDKNIPEKIIWNASDNPDGEKFSEVNAINLALWDQHKKNTLRIDLWTKEMTVDEMKRFYVDCLGGMSQTILNATGDEFMANEMNDLCEKFVEYIKKNAQ